MPPRGPVHEVTGLLNIIPRRKVNGSKGRRVNDLGIGGMGETPEGRDGGRTEEWPGNSVRFHGENPNTQWSGGGRNCIIG